VKALLPFLLILPSLGDPTDFTRKAEQWMASTEAPKRQAAYRTWLQLGPDAMPNYQQALERSLKLHDQAIDRLCAGGRGQPNPYADHQLVADELDAGRTRVIPLIRTDWQKDPKQVAMLREEMQGLESLLAKVTRAAQADTRNFDHAIDGHLAALTEVRRELERFDPDADSRGLDDDELRDQVLRDQLEASHLEELRQRFRATRALLDDHAAVRKAHDTAGPWSDGSMTTFAGILNSQRLILGLGPLQLDEKLCDAAKGHSSDMARLGFFAHESPVPEKKTPWDRARKAGFSGNASGENIFMGSAEPQSAYNGWFGSDGHRFIMLASGPNTLGVGISGVHWTMMTGRK
jgi:uncharacterized protein YkwD